MKTVTLCRHAKASAPDPKGEDHDRPLLKRGKQDIAQIAKRSKKWLRKPDLVVVSSALRAEQTAVIFAKESGLKKKAIDLRKELYTASAADCLTLLRALPDELESVMLVGHTPAIEELAHTLIQDFTCALPTSAVASARFNLKAWRGLRPHSGKLSYFDYPNYSAEQAQPLKDCKNQIEAELSETMIKQLDKVDPDVTGEVASQIAKASSRIAGAFTDAIKKSRKHGTLLRLTAPSPVATRPTRKKTAKKETVQNDTATEDKDNAAK